MRGRSSRSWSQIAATLASLLLAVPASGESRATEADAAASGASEPDAAGTRADESGTKQAGPFGDKTQPCRRSFRVRPIAASRAWSFGVASPLADSVLIDPSGRSYLTTTDGTIYALGRDGQLLWSYTGVGGISAGASKRSLGGVYFGTHAGRLYAIDETGRAQWVFYVSTAIVSQIVESPSGFVWFIGGDDVLYAISNRKGLLWMKPLEGELIAGPELLEDGSLGLVLRPETERGLLLWRSRRYSQVERIPLPETAASSPGIGTESTAPSASVLLESPEVGSTWPTRSAVLTPSQMLSIESGPDASRWRWLGLPRFGSLPAADWPPLGCVALQRGARDGSSVRLLGSGILAAYWAPELWLIDPRGDAVSWVAPFSPKHPPSVDAASGRIVLAGDSRVEAWTLERPVGAAASVEVQRIFRGLMP